MLLHIFKWTDMQNHIYLKITPKVMFPIMLAHDVRDRCWWHESRGWTFLLINVYLNLLYIPAEQQSGKMASVMKVSTKLYVTENEYKAVCYWIPLCGGGGEMLHSSIFVEHLHETNKWHELNLWVILYSIVAVKSGSFWWYGFYKSLCRLVCCW